MSVTALAQVQSFQESRVGEATQCPGWRSLAHGIGGLRFHGLTLFTRPGILAVRN
jgi:hypothetical protein